MLNKLIALGLLAGLLVGLGAAMTGNTFLHGIARESAPLGKLFINAIKMVVIPLVVTVIFSSIARLGDVKTLGRIGGITLVFYWATLIPAILLGMGVMALGLNFTPDLTMPSVEAAPIPKLQSLSDFFISLIPANPFAAATNGAILPLIVFTALFAAAAGTMPKDRKERMITGAEDISSVLIKLVWWILYTAPLGIFGLIAPATAVLGWSLIQSLAIFIICVFIALTLLVLCVFLPLVLGVAKIKPLHFFKSITGALSIAFSTTSTAAALPVTLEETITKLGVSKSVAELLIPLGASMYRPGSALFQGAAIVFLAHIYGLPIALSAAGAVLFATFLVSLTIAPVPSASVVTMAPALEALGVPLAGLAFMLGIDRIPDMMRSSVNVLGHIAAAALIDAKVTSQADIPD